jgi:hypothetical protein
VHKSTPNERRAQAVPQADEEPSQDLVLPSSVSTEVVDPMKPSTLYLEQPEDGSTKGYCEICGVDSVGVHTTVC